MAYKELNIGLIHIREFITNTPDRQDVLGIGRVGFDLGPQTVDIGVDGMVVTVVAVSPYMFQKLGPVKYPPGPAEQARPSEPAATR